jgi:multidrug efflux pump
MQLSRFFIDRPIFAAVLSIVIFLAGGIAMFALPISEYPEVVPPSVVVRAVYPGANPRVLSEAVATPLEEQINGVENMLYMSSQSTSDGVLTLTVTFRVGTDVDLAQVQVQNRVAQALPRLPDEVRQLGVTTVKSSPNFIMVVHLLSPDNRYDITYLRNYGLLQVKDVLARIPGIGQVEVFGGGDYSMRVWLDPGKVAARGLAAGDVVNAIREQNVQVAAGVVGAPPMPVPVDYQLTINARGRLTTEGSSAPSSSRPARTARSPGCVTSHGSSWGPVTTRCARCWMERRPSASASSRRQAPTRCSSPTLCAPPWTS